MSVFVRKVVTKSGANAVQIVTKHGREIAGIEHIGSAHTEKDLAVLVEVARERKRERTREAGQEELDLGLEGSVDYAVRKGPGTRQGRRDRHR